VADLCIPVRARLLGSELALGWEGAAWVDSTANEAGPCEVPRSTGRPQERQMRNHEAMGATPSHLGLPYPVLVASILRDQS